MAADTIIDSADPAVLRRGSIWRRISSSPSPRHTIVYGVRQDVTSSAPYARPSHLGVHPSLEITCVLTVDLGNSPSQCKLAAMHTVAINNIMTIHSLPVYLELLPLKPQPRPASMGTAHDACASSCPAYYAPSASRQMRL